MLHGPQANEQKKALQPPLQDNGNAGGHGEQREQREQGGHSGQGSNGPNGGTGSNAPDGGKVYLRYFSWHVFTLVVLASWLVYSALPGLLVGTTAGWSISWALFSLVYMLWVSVLLVFAGMGQGQWGYLLPGQISWALALFRQEPKRFAMPLREEMPQQAAFSQSLSLYLPPRTYSVLSGEQARQRKATMRMLLAAVWLYSPLMVYTNGLVCLRAMFLVVLSLETVPSGVLLGGLACVAIVMGVLRLKRFFYVYNRLGTKEPIALLRLPVDDVPGVFTNASHTAQDAPRTPAAEAAEAYAKVASMPEARQAEPDAKVPSIPEASAEEIAAEKQKAQRLTTLRFWSYWVALAGGCTVLILTMVGLLPHPDYELIGNWFGMIPWFIVLYLVGPFALGFLLWQCALALRWQHGWGYLTPEQVETARYMVQRNPECTEMPAREELDARMEEALRGAQAPPRTKRRADYSPPTGATAGAVTGTAQRKKLLRGLKATALVYDRMAGLAGIAFLAGVGCLLLATYGAGENGLAELHTLGLSFYMGGCFGLGTMFYKRL